MNAPPDIAWVTVNRAALRHNVGAIRALTEQNGTPVPRLIAVVKANAFGHGAVPTAQTLEAAGVDFFAVTTLAEALELRAGRINSRILVFLPLLPGQTEAAVAAGLDVTVCDEGGARALELEAERQDTTVAVHLKVDTGMGRLGALPADALPLTRRIATSPSLRLAGLYTHFARALERDPRPTQAQFAVFQQVRTSLAGEGIRPELCHCANSAALVRFPEMRLDAVRPGTILYGQFPSAAVPRMLDLQDTWRLEARIAAVREVPAGTAVGYGGEFVTRRPTRLAILPIGYADGFTLQPASATGGKRGLQTLLRDFGRGGPRLFVTVRGQRVPVIGRVAMQMCALDVTDLPGVAVGDVAVVPARRITASARLPRVYED